MSAIEPIEPIDKKRQSKNKSTKKSDFKDIAEENDFYMQVLHQLAVA